jgi:hypothetical protein
MKMAWGFFKKIGDGLKKAFNFVKDKVVKPAVGIVAPLAQQFGPTIGSMFGPEGAAIGTAIAGGAGMAESILGTRRHEWDEE